MSLVNRMLQDLEARSGEVRHTRPIFDDLQPTPAGPRVVAGQLILLVVALLVVGVGGYSAWRYFSDTPVPVMQNANTPAVTTAASIAPPAAPVETSTPLPVAAAVPTQSPTADKPSVAPARKTPAATRPRAPAPHQSETVQFQKTERPYTPDELAAMEYREALLARNQGNPSEAERRLKALLATQPKQVAARELLASVQIGNGHWPEAQSTLEQGIVQVPTHAGFRIQLASLLLNHGNEARAVGVLEQARRDQVQDAELTAFLAALYQRAGRHAEAIARFQEALARKPGEGKWWLGLGISLEAKPDPAAARDAYRRALDTAQLPASLVDYAQARLKFLTTP